VLNSAIFFIIILYLLLLEIQLLRCKCWNPIKRFNPTTYLCLSQGRTCISYFQYWQELEDAKGVIIICKSKKDRQLIGQKIKDIRTNNDLQNITQKIKDQATWTSLKTGSELGCSRRVGSSCYYYVGAIMVVIIWSLDLKLPVYSVHITTYVFLIRN
jgi:hypothetical protein